MGILLVLWNIIKEIAKAIPLRVWIFLAIASALVGYHLYALHEVRKEMRESCQKKAKALEEERDAAVAKLKTAQGKVIVQEVVKYRDRIVKVKEAGDVITKLIPLVVHDSDCPLSGGFRVLHDAATSGIIPNDPEGTSRTAPAVDPVTAAETITTNYKACLANAEQLRTLQAIAVTLPTLGEVK